MARLLVVEDEIAVRDALAEGLRSTGHEVVTAASAREARPFLVGGASSFDAILTDLQAPCDGLLNLERAHAASPELPVLVMSGTQERSAPAEALARGAFAFLPKPVTFQKLNTELERALASGTPAEHCSSVRGVVHRLTEMGSVCQESARRLINDPRRLSHS